VGTLIKQEILENSSTEVASLSKEEKVKKFYRFKGDYFPQKDRMDFLLERVSSNEQRKTLIEFDLLEEGEKKLLVRGGQGGFGNPHFVTPQILGPSFAGRGIPGETLHIELELKTLADAGLVGLPNAGKS
jgi:GTP-binding protein